jgi:ABC-type dipeptide/oligopeptide/nickel transport system ATPase component
MQKGLIVETGKTSVVFGRPEHRYTQMLIRSIPGYP